MECLGDGGGDGDHFLEGLAVVLRVGGGVEDECGVGLVGVLEFLDYGTPGVCPAFPVDEAEGITGAVIAKADEVAGGANGVGGLVEADGGVCGAGDVEGGDGVDFWKDEEGRALGGDFAVFLEEAEGVREKDTEVLEGVEAAFEGCEGEGDGEGFPGFQREIMAGGG